MHEKIMKTLRERTIRLAARFPKGSEERGSLLAALKSAGFPHPKDAQHAERVKFILGKAAQNANRAISSRQDEVYEAKMAVDRLKKALANWDYQALADEDVISRQELSYLKKVM